MKLAFSAGDKPFGLESAGLAYAAKRGLFWLGDSGWNGGVWVLRFDPATAETTLK